MRKKLMFYKTLLIEIIETLCTICLYLEKDGYRSLNSEGGKMRTHFKVLKDFSNQLRNEVNS